VELLRPLTNALLAKDYEKIEELHNQMSKTEHEADQIKTAMRDNISKMYFLSVGRLEFSQFLAYQDDVADAAEDFAVVLLIRKTKLPEELKSDFMNFVEQVISVSEESCLCGRRSRGNAEIYCKNRRRRMAGRPVGKKICPASL
jgi:predicted phosphate transport protein (TIGR00153 family)